MGNGKNWTRKSIESGALFVSDAHAEELSRERIEEFYAFLGNHTVKVQQRNVTTFLLLENVLRNGPEKLLVKKYPKPGSKRKLKDFFRWGKGVREFLHSFPIMNAGIPIPEPVAAFSAKIGKVPKETYFIEEDVHDARNLKTIAQEPGLDIATPELRNEFTRALGAFVRSCHDKGLFHGDLNGTNVLAAPLGDAKWRFTIIDLENAQLVKELSLHQRVKDLARLEQHLGIHSRFSESTRFFDAYAGDDEELKRDMKNIAGLVRERIQKNLESRLKHVHIGSETKKLARRYGDDGDDS